MKFQEMYVVIFGVVILKLQISVSDPQFPRHTDFLKVGEAILNNEKFNILKPTVHLVTDHFKDFMLRQESAHSGERVFIDKNGFRHSWSGFGDKTKSLRKTDLKSKLKHISGSFENVSEKTSESGFVSTDGNDNDNTTATVGDNNENENNYHEEENSASSNTETVQNLTEHIQNATHTHKMNSTQMTIKKRTSDKNKTVIKVDGRKGNAKATVANPQQKRTPKKNTINKPKNTQTTRVNVTKKAKPKGTQTTRANVKKKANLKGTQTTRANITKKVNPKGTQTTRANVTKKANPKGTPTIRARGMMMPLMPLAANPNDNKPIAKERTVATTTFFCPFFGVITMSAFID